MQNKDTKEQTSEKEQEIIYTFKDIEINPPRTEIKEKQEQEIISDEIKNKYQITERKKRHISKRKTSHLKPSIQSPVSQKPITHLHKTTSLSQSPFPKKPSTYPRGHPGDNSQIIESTAQGLPLVQVLTSVANLHEGHLGEVTKGWGSDLTKSPPLQSPLPRPKMKAEGGPERIKKVAHRRTTNKDRKKR